MDWLRYFHFSLPDHRGLISRRTVILTMMAVIIYQSVGIFYKTVALQLIRMRPAQAAEKVRAAAVMVREPTDVYHVIPERNLFGTTTKAVAEKQTAVVQRDIALILELKGTVAGDEKYGFAIVEEKGNQKQRLVKVGDVVAGAKVIRIHRNAVDFLMDDQERTLKIVEASRPFFQPAVSRAAVTSPPAQGGPIMINRSDITVALQDMGSMLSQAQVRPHFNDGAPDGFMVSNIQAGSLYQRMGIVDGDIIQAANNRPIQTADDVMVLFNILKSNAEMTLTFSRQRSQKTLNYRFQ